MPVGLHHEAGGKVLIVKIVGKLTKEDYHNFVPQIERLIAEQGKIRVLVDMEDFHGWSLGALWEDIKFDFRHFKDIERVALVGNRKWEAGMASFCKPFTAATVKYFDQTKITEAHEWIKEGIPQPV